MRKELQATLANVKNRCFHGVDSEKADEVMTELAVVMCCTAGPVVMAAFIERGLEVFRQTKKRKRKK